VRIESAFIAEHGEWIR
jgi:hypothetical protein